MIGDLDRATFNNIEHLSLEFVTFCRAPWFIRWQQALARDLMSAKMRASVLLRIPLASTDRLGRPPALPVVERWDYLRLGQSKPSARARRVQSGAESRRVSRRSTSRSSARRRRRPRTNSCGRRRPGAIRRPPTTMTATSARRSSKPIATW